MLLGALVALTGASGAHAEGPPTDVPPRIVGLVAALDDANETVVKDALKQLREASEADPGLWKSEEALPLKHRIAALLDDPHSVIQGDVLAVLGSMGEGAREQATLVTLLESPEAFVRERAVQALGGMGEAAREQARASPRSRSRLSVRCRARGCGGPRLRSGRPSEPPALPRLRSDGPAHNLRRAVT